MSGLATKIISYEKAILRNSQILRCELSEQTQIWEIQQLCQQVSKNRLINIQLHSLTIGITNK